MPQRELIDRYIDRAGRGPELLWYYTPMALSFTRHLQADLPSTTTWTNCLHSVAHRSRC